MSGSQQLLLGGAPAAVPVDPYFYSVTSLLHGDGTNGAQNNTFLDSSTNNFTITRNGNTTQGSFSPFSQTGWGNYFNGTDAYLQTPANSALTPSTSTTPFTLEAWIYPTSSTTGNCIITQTLGTGIRYSLALGSSVSNLGGGLKVWFGFFTGISWSGLASSSSVSLDTWTHVAAVFTGSTCKIFINGVEDASGGPSTWTTAAASNVVLVGRRWDTFATPYYFQGYISNARVVIGTAVYTSAFTPSTTPLTAITNTQLLTCQSNRFIDNSSNAFAITVNGSPSVQPFSPFNPTTAYSTSAVGGSGYFDGSGDYLTAPANSAWACAGDYSVEAWVYIPALSSDMHVFGTGGAGANDQFNVESDGQFYWQAQGSPVGSVVAGMWNHLLATRSGSVFRGFINGVLRTYNASVTGTVGQNATMYIGRRSDGNNSMLGYISNIRYINGSIPTGYQTSSTTLGTQVFTPPTAPFTTTSQGATSGDVKLLTNFTNAGIFDNAADADYETVGNAQISTSVKKYGTGSIAFDGTGDYLNAPSRQITALTGDFTIEFWAYRNSGNFRAFNIGDDNLSTGLGLVYNNSLDDWFLYNSNASQITTGTLATTTWTHVAVNRTAGVVKLYLNGTQAGSWSSTATFSGAVYIGAELYSGTVYSDTNGYIDDFRISNGVGRYPYNFTPPTAEFPNIGGTVTLTADPYFDYTTLLLPGNGTNGAQNNTFLDSSTNAFSITRNGNTTQGTFSPFSQTGWGNYFDGSGDYLETPSNAAFTLGSSGDFTVECWVYATATPGNYAAFMTTWSDANTGYSNRWFLGVHDSKIKWYNDAGGSAIADSSNIQLNTWLHVAVARSGSTITLYINGTAIGTQTTSQSYTTQGTVKLGYSGTGGNYFSGYISNARVVKGTAVYTAAFTPPTAPLTAITNTSLLTCQSNRFIDNSTNAFAITRNGDVSVQAFSPFNPTAAWSAATNGGSGYFDGSGDFLTAADSTAWDLSGDYTIEMWLYVTSTPSSPTFFQLGESSNYLLWYLASATKYLTLAGSASITASTAMSLNAWNHIALVRSGSGTNNTVMYLNGVNVGQTTNNTSFTGSASNGVRIGAEYPSGFYVNGYISDVRIVKGTAVYTSAFTPPTAPLTAITNTQLLTNFTNAGIYDATSKNDLETVGNAQISTTQSKFGGSSMYFDGSGDWLKLSNNTAAQAQGFGTGDFTIECWVYIISSTVANNGIYDCRYSASATGPLIYYIPTSGLFMFYNGSNQISGGTITINTWNHIALVRYSGVTKLYINGTQSGSNYADTNNYTSGANSGAVGAFYDGTGGWNGYIDDLRVTRGIARYTSNFTPPTTAFLTL